jgi:hypothetical protein
MRPPASPSRRRAPPVATPPTDPPDRARELARLAGLWPAEIGDVSPAGRARLVAKLEEVLRAERRRGRAGHWTYDLARHAALVRTLRRERAALAKLARKTIATDKSAGG